VGTVGAVALDLNGHLASASSSGGLTGKLPGRISDSSIPGAGFYADDRLAVSLTGSGDDFIRVSAARQVAEKFHQGNKLEPACKFLFEILRASHVGVIAVDTHGEIVQTFNTPGMFRAHGKTNDSDEAIVTAIFQ